MFTTIWLRNEVKKNEQRTALTPKNAAKLIEAGHQVIVEKSSDRIFKEDDYRHAGCMIVDTNTWKESNLENCYILGLKELPLNKEPLSHKHIYFAHIYKGQADSPEVFSQYRQGGGTLFDLEHLLNPKSARIAAFGYWAGYIGAAISVQAYCHQMKHLASPKLKHYTNKSDWITILSDDLKDLPPPSTIIIGSLGRVGSGAQALLNELGLQQQTLWDYQETKSGGPFKAIIEHDIFINAVLMTHKIAPFIDMALVKSNPKLKIIGDVSCDPNSELNPIPIYNQHTTWDNTTLDISESPTPLSIIAIDNLPSALPRESSEDFSDQLLPHLLDLCNEGEQSYTWQTAKSIFNEKKENPN